MCVERDKVLYSILLFVIKEINFNVFQTYFFLFIHFILDYNGLKEKRQNCRKLLPSTENQVVKHMSLGDILIQNATFHTLPTPYRKVIKVPTLGFLDSIR